MINKLPSMVLTALIVFLATEVNAFTAPLSSTTVGTRTSSALSMSTAEQKTTIETDDESKNFKGLLKRDRYVATNRFAVRADKQAKFEKRWATRKSRLAELDGFRYFHLMRRVKVPDNDPTSDEVVYDDGLESGSQMGNYVSFTIWDTKADFNAWRNGEAFVEAHGGKSIGSFVSTLISSAFVLQGAPRPAFYDGLLLQQGEVKLTQNAKIEGGWRADVVADGVSTLPKECFVACNQFFVPPENAAAFEERWAGRQSKLLENEGFVAFSMLRRDGSAKGHGTSPVTSDEPSYMSATIWKDYESFKKWRYGDAFGKAHGEKPKGQGKPAESNGPPRQPLWSQPPKPVFYEGTLVIESEAGP